MTASISNSYSAAPDRISPSYTSRPSSRSSFSSRKVPSPPARPATMALASASVSAASVLPPLW